MDFETLVPQTIGGGGGSSYTEVATYADLPVGPPSGTVYLVQQSTGVWPFRKYAGLWRWTGTQWEWLGNYSWVSSEIAYTAGGNLVATDVQGAIAELDSEKATPADISSAVTAHEAAGDPHPQYLTAAEGNALYQPVDSDLSSIAALTTTAYGRALLTLADAAGLTALLNTFTSALKGLVPASGGGTTNFLRADGTWAAPSGGSDPWTWSILGADVANSTVTLATSGLTFTAAPNKTYVVEVVGTFQAAATTTGIALALDIPDGSVTGQIIHPSSATALTGTEQIADNATTGATTGVRAATTNVSITARFIYRAGGTGGTVTLMFRSEVAASAVTLKANLTALGSRAIN